MSGYIGNIPTPQATQTRDTFTATSGQTSFATSGYTPGFLDVFLNGVHLVNGTDYTASNGSDVVLTTGAATSDIVEVLSYSTYEVNAQTYTGGLTAKNDGAAAITANRLSSAGTVIDIKEGGTTYGEIGTASTSLFMGTTDTGVLFYDAGNSILPFNPGTGTRDNAIDLGRTTDRFKNLYLSGGVYLGGTGGENLLDDYEEGSFTPTFTRFTTNPTYTVSQAAGQYVKIGGVVHVQGVIVVSGVSSSGTGNLRISGLPFASDGSTYSGVVNIGYNDTFDAAVKDGYVNTTDIQLIPTGITQGNYGGVLSTGYCGFTGTYYTSA